MTSKGNNVSYFDCFSMNLTRLTTFTECTSIIQIKSNIALNIVTEMFNIF